MNRDNTLNSAMSVLDEFFKDTAVMLKILKDILVSEYDYKDITPGSGVCRENSASLDLPVKWTPPYLSLSFKKEEEYISITIILKEYWKLFKPKIDYHIYGVKFQNLVDGNRRISWIGKDAVEYPYHEYKRAEKEDYTEVERKDFFGSCKFIKMSLWDMKDKQAVADFAKRVVEL